MSSTGWSLAGGVIARRVADLRHERSVYVVSPPEGLCGQIILLHGLAEHALRNVGLARDLAADGFRVVLLDQLAHGSAAGAVAAELEDVYFAATTAPDLIRSLRAVSPAPHEKRRRRRTWLSLMRSTSMDSHIADVVGLVETLCQRGELVRGVPLFVGGHSMGGLLALATARRLSDIGRTVPAGVFALSPALGARARLLAEGRSARLANAAMELLVRASWWSRGHRVGAPVRALIDAMARTAPAVDCGWVAAHTSDLPDEQRAFAADPLVAPAVPVSYLNAIEALMWDMHSLAPSYPVPAFIAYPDLDVIVDGNQTTAFVARWTAAGNGVPVVEMAIPGFAFHVLDRSSVRDRLMSELRAWLSAAIG